MDIFILKIIGIYLIVDGLLSVIVLGNFDLEIKNVFRYIRSLIGIYLFFKND